MKGALGGLNWRRREDEGDVNYEVDRGTRSGRITLDDDNHITLESDSGMMIDQSPAILLPDTVNLEKMDERRLGMTQRDVE